MRSLICRAIVLGAFLWLAVPARALAGGSISGIVKDQSGAAVPDAQLTLIDIGLKTEFKAISDARGFYSFPALPVRRYDLRIEATGFKPQQRTNIAIDADAAITVDTVLAIGQRSDTVTVVDTEASIATQVESVATHLGEVVSDVQGRLLRAAALVSLLNFWNRASESAHPGNQSVRPDPSTACEGNVVCSSSEPYYRG